MTICQFSSPSSIVWVKDVIDIIRNTTIELCLIALEPVKWIIFLQLVVGVPLPLPMVPLRHIKTQLRELRYSSSATHAGFVPAGGMRAMCGADGRWNPDPAGVGCTSKHRLYFDSYVYIRQ